MCEACSKILNRRSLLRGALVAGATAATSSLWLPAELTDAAGDVFETAAMAEDTTKATRRATTAAGPAAAPAAAPAQSSNAVVAVAGTRNIPAPNTNALKAPPILARQQWGADESIRFDNRAYAPVRKLIVHHTASANKPGNPAEVVRFVQRYHSVGRGYIDTGYNYLIDHKGVIYEGRAALQYGADGVITGEDNKGWGVVGAHAKGNNAGSCGICLIGDFDTGSPTDASVLSLIWLLAYKVSRHRIDPTASEDYIDLYGNRRNYPNISGHRQVGATACPGGRLFKLLPTIRDEVARRAGHWDPLLVDVPGVLRYEGGPLRVAKSIASTADATGSSTGGDPGSGTRLIGVRVVSEPGRIYTAGNGRRHGDPSASGATKVVALANTLRGDGYWALTQDAKVFGFGGVATFGDASGKGVAADLAVTGTGKGYWILMADGGIFPFGDAGYASSPRRAGLGGVSRRIVARPQADGYWVLVDGVVRAFGAAAKFGSPTESGNPIDFCRDPVRPGLLGADRRRDRGPLRRCPGQGRCQAGWHQMVVAPGDPSRCHTERQRLRHRQCRGFDAGVRRCPAVRLVRRERDEGHWSRSRIW